MADDKSGREDQARDVERRQRERDLLLELERWDETEPPTESETLDALESKLSSLTFPATGAEVVAAAGDASVESSDGTHTVAALIPDTESTHFDSPSAVRMRVVRPTVAAATKRILEAVDTLPNATLEVGRREAYEKTLRALVAIDADDEDEGVETVTDWIVERIHEKQTIPGSRKVRQRAAKFCRANGYEVRDDQWLGA